jgi:hypothetical protein
MIISYPLILFICWFPIQVADFINFLKPELNIMVFTNLSIILFNFHGFFNSFIYGYFSINILDVCTLCKV